VCENFSPWRFPHIWAFDTGPQPVRLFIQLEPCRFHFIMSHTNLTRGNNCHSFELLSFVSPVL
jgi:hypothetical protein